MKKNNLKRIIVFCFVLVPLLSSCISTVHLVDLFYLGNPSWISYTIALSIEVGAIASFLTLSILSKINKGIVWSIFIILFVMQIIGNVYYSYDWITKRIVENSNWIMNFREMMSFFVDEIDEKASKMILSMLIGIPIPIISVFLLKATTDYIGDDSEKIIVDSDKNVSTINETVPSIPSLTLEELFLEEEQKAEENKIHISNDDADKNDELARRRIHPARS